MHSDRYRNYTRDGVCTTQPDDAADAGRVGAVGGGNSFTQSTLLLFITEDVH